ncbi:MAG TPA: hypothetical protein VM680_16100 [Verrucomicrobiae bacterium]|nr:hypothetical protein [Verrucomicrobiae bacterium]
MTFWKIVFTFIALVAWLPATVHCELEAAGFFPMDECCETQGQGNHRCDSGCNIVEDGGIKTECVCALPAPSMVCIVLPELSLLPVTDRLRALEPHKTDFKNNHLPEFLIATALPIRGPSLAS